MPILNGKLSDEDFKLLNMFIKIVDANLGKKSEWNERLGRAEGLATKCFEHSATALYLLNGTKLPGPIEFLDASTIHVTTRAALETLLTFAYLFTLPDDVDESDFFLFMDDGRFDDPPNLPTFYFRT
jgi:hypothetical protein